MYVKSPLKKQAVKENRRTLSKGKPAARKKKDFFAQKINTGGSAPKYGRRLKKDPIKITSNLPAFTPWKVILASFLIGVCGILYIGHVFSTQQLLQEVQQLENEFNRTKRLYDEKRLAHDRLVGPKEIYQKARDEGFVNAGPASQVILVKP